MNVIDLVCLVVAAYLAVRLGDRLRLINWRTTKPLYVGLYLSHMLWALGVVHSIFDSGVHWPQVFGLSAMFCWLQVTRQHWPGDSVPDEATKPGELGPAELHPMMRRKGDAR